ELSAMPRQSPLGDDTTAPSADDDGLFRQEWVRALFADAVATLRESCAASGKQTHFVVFERYDLDDAIDGRPTYAQLGADLGIPITQVTNHLAFARRELRRLVLERIGQGGMGTIYRAHDRELGRDVAFKVIRLPEASPDVAARMVREARTLA